MEVSAISNFYTNQTIFITGGTGFVGKVLVEKLLRTCNDLKKIYLLVRSKKNKTPQERFDALFSLPCFSRLQTERIEYKSKVFLINGDCDERNLGLSEDDLALLTEEVTVVFHAAADVKFNQPLKKVSHTLQATIDILNIAKKMPRLKVFIHVSTAYSNCIHKHIKEEFYEPPMTADKFLSMVHCLDDDILEVATPHVLKNWPNTYVYIKSIIEDLVKREAKNLPAAIVRPAVIVCSAEEPLPGWIDNFYGIVGVGGGASLGVIKSIYVKHDAICPFVPVDYVSNYILAVGWALQQQQNEEIVIYNYVGHKDNLLIAKMYLDVLTPKIYSIITVKQIMYYSCCITQSNLWHEINIFFLHTCLSYFADFVLICIGREPLAVEAYKKLNTQLRLLSYFMTHNWIFDHNNMLKLWKQMSLKDQKLFNFNMEHLDWTEFLEQCAIGSRIYLLKDPLETIPRALKKQKILMVVHYTAIIVFWYLVYKLFAFIFGFFM